MLKRIVLSSIILLLYSSVQSQKVASKPYNLMLKTLLSHSANEITVDELTTLLQTNEDIVLVDSREKKEYEVSHLKNALWVGYDDFDMVRLNEISKDKKVIVYCSVGARSEKICNRLSEAGYTDVSNLYGGIFEWVNAGESVVNKTGNTVNVHAYNKVWGIWLKKGNKVYD